ncbi:acylphosphatase [Patescibacteria group bacterium]|nr:acylphosphatase [Patescibacteria group bacterium]MCL5797781.1 acylphosphatase [Patescibacteria group bacterium]
MMDKRAHVFIYGDVVGVGFRSWAVTNARDLGLTGWVKNLSGDTVEVVFEGDKESIDEMIKRCEKGPSTSSVDDVEVKLEDATGEYEDFTII